jgi:hypothetical protein
MKWRGTMAQQERISDERTRVKMLLKQLLRIKDFRSREKVDLQLKDAIFNYLLQKRLRFSHYIPLPDPGMNNLNEILAERGDQVLRTEGCLEGKFRESLLLWYIATDICYYDDSRTNIGAYVDPNARISKSLSNYMQYVLTDYPLMLPKMIQGEGNELTQQFCYKIITFSITLAQSCLHLNWDAVIYKQKGLCMTLHINTN